MAGPWERVDEIAAAKKTAPAATAKPPWERIDEIAAQKDRDPRLGPRYGTQEKPGPDLPPEVAEKRAGIVQPYRQQPGGDTDAKTLFEQREKLPKGSPEYVDMTKRIARAQTRRDDEATVSGLPIGRIGGGVKSITEKGVMPVAKAAHDAGFVMTPAMVTKSPGIINKVLAGVGGKIKTQQEASVQNAERATTMARSSLGIPLGKELNETTYKTFREQQGRHYAAISKAVPKLELDNDFLTDMTKMLDRDPQAAALWPDIVKNPQVEKLVDGLMSQEKFDTSAGMFLVRSLRRQGIQNMKAVGDAEKNELGLMQRKAADAVDALIERTLAKSGKAGLATEYRIARQRIAQSYDLEAATDPATGMVDGMKLAALKMRGRPLSGNLDAIADAALAFRPAFQNPARFGGVEDHSVLDFFGMASAALHGNLPAAAGVGAGIIGRPAARRAVLSPSRQDAMFRERPKPGEPREYPNVPAGSAVPYGEDDDEVENRRVISERHIPADQ